MTSVGACEKLFKEINTQIEMHQIIVVTGAIVDASVNEIANSDKVINRVNIALPKGHQSNRNEALLKKNLKKHIL